MASGPQPIEVGSRRSSLPAQVAINSTRTSELSNTPHQNALSELIFVNPIAAIGAFAAILAAMTTIVTFIFNFNFTIRSQRDNQFFEALKRFGDQTSPGLRASAAGLLGKMADSKAYFSTSLDQLTIGLYQEQDDFVFGANKKALLRLAVLRQTSVLDSLRQLNLQLQEDIIKLIAKVKFAYTLKESKDISNFIPQQKISEIDGLWFVTVINVSGFDRNALNLLISRHQADFDKSYVAESVRFQGSNADQNINVQMQNSITQIMEKCQSIRKINTFLSYIIRSTRLLHSFGDVLTKKGYVRRYNSGFKWFTPKLMMSGVFAPDFDLSTSLIVKGDFSGALLPRADFSNCDLLACNFGNTDLSESDFSGSRIRSSPDVRTPWSFGSGPLAFFRGANLRQANLQKVIFDRVVMIDAGLTDARMHGTQIADNQYWNGANWWKANFDLDEDNFFTLDADQDLKTTEFSLNKLLEKYSKALPNNLCTAHPSIKRFLADRPDIEQPVLS